MNCKLFVVQVILLFIVRFHPALAPFNKGDTKSWVAAVDRTGSKQDQRKNAGIIFFSWWFIWKEHNLRIFDHKKNSSLQVAFPIKEALLSYRRAFAM
jgi:hypothetical protein